MNRSATKPQQRSAEPMTPATDIQVPLATEEFWREFVALRVEVKFRKEYRRRNVRFVTMGDARAFFERDGRQISTGVDLMELSGKGMGIRAPSHIPPETIVLVRFNDVEPPFAVKGRVMHSTGTLGGHKIGIEILFAEP